MGDLRTFLNERQSKAAEELAAVADSEFRRDPAGVVARVLDEYSFEELVISSTMFFVPQPIPNV
jgi:hypothetical protein